MNEIAKNLLILGALLLSGLLIEAIGKKTFLPRVTLLLLFGFIIGPQGLDVLLGFQEEWFPLIAEMALLMVGFLLGSKMSWKNLKYHGRKILVFSLIVVLSTFILVSLGLMWVSYNLNLAILLASLAAATDPAATVDVVHEVQAKGSFTNTLLGIVAMDDIWGIILFSIAMGMTQALMGVGSFAEALKSGLWELGGSFLLGLCLGIPMSYLSGRLQKGQPTRIEALGIVFICGGLAEWLGVSFLLASIVMGVTVVNLSAHHTRPFHAIKNIESPFMLIFFILAGAHLKIDTLEPVAVLCIAYIGFRILSRIVGGRLGGFWTQSNSRAKHWMGLALLPQAGVALGMGLMVSQKIPEFENILLPIVIASTVFFELIGPVFTKLALIQVQEVPNASAK